MVRSASTSSTGEVASVEDRVADALCSLLDAGEDMTALSVERIITKAYVARSTFYAYFGDKYGVLRRIGRVAVTEVVEASEGWTSFPPLAGREELRAAFAHLATVYRQHAPVLAAMSQASRFDNDVRNEFRSMSFRGERNLTDHILQMQEVGAVRTDVDAPTMSAWLATAIEGGLYSHIRRASSKEAIARHVETLTDIIWNTLYEQAPQRNDEAGSVAEG